MVRRDAASLVWEFEVPEAFYKRNYPKGLDLESPQLAQLKGGATKKDFIEIVKRCGDSMSLTSRFKGRYLYTYHELEWV